MTAQDPSSGALWQVPYLPIDPKDIGCSYEAIIRINSQSGKGGVAYVMETEFGYQLPKAMHAEMGKIIKQLADESGEELSGMQIFQTFQQEYLDCNGPFALETFHMEEIDGQDGTKNHSMYSPHLYRRYRTRIPGPWQRAHRRICAGAQSG